MSLGCSCYCPLFEHCTSFGSRTFNVHNSVKWTMQNETAHTIRKQSNWKEGKRDRRNIGRSWFDFYISLKNVFGFLCVQDLYMTKCCVYLLSKIASQTDTRHRNSPIYSCAWLSFSLPIANAHVHQLHQNEWYQNVYLMFVNYSSRLLKITFVLICHHNVVRLVSGFAKVGRSPYFVAAIHSIVESIICE